MGEPRDNPLVDEFAKRIRREWDERAWPDGAAVPEGHPMDDPDRKRIPWIILPEVPGD